MSSAGGLADPAYLLDAAGPAAPPRDNGELVFDAPWESQAFGVAMALHQAGAFGWEDFRQLLIAEIGAWQASGAPGQEWSYYRCWLAALERLVSERGLVGPDELRARVAELAAAPPDHGPPGHTHGEEAAGPGHDH